MNAYVLLLVVCLLTCAGQLCQKQAANQGEGILAHRTLLWLALAVGLLGLGLLLWLRVLQQLPLSIAYPMLSLNFIGVTLAARFVFDEPLTVRHWGGIMLIMLGVSLLGGLG